MLTVPYFEVCDRSAVEQVLQQLPAHSIACNNWPEASFPYAPEATFKAFHDGKNLHIEFSVAEDYTRALETRAGHKVCTDSCVEFFLMPDDTFYYNFEWNCIGTLYAACRTGRHDPTPAPDNVLQSIRTVASLGKAPFDERCGHQTWRLSAAIPIEALFRHPIASWHGLHMRANLYKCGDALSHPHYLSFAPIRTPAPDFHRPEFFIDLIFE